MFINMKNTNLTHHSSNFRQKINLLVNEKIVKTLIFQVLVINMILMEILF